MIRASLLSLFLLTNLAGFSIGIYAIQLRDKQQNTYSIHHPEQFLSPRAIDRREKQHIAIDLTDLPISISYLNTLQSKGAIILYTSKWLNTACAELASDSILSIINNLPFVLRVQKISSTEGARSSQQSNKFEQADALHYGTALRQIDMLHGDSLHQMGYEGEGVLIAMFDAGFQGINKLVGFDSLFAENRVLDTYDFVNHKPDVYDMGAHGCYTSSLITGNIVDSFLGTAPHANFLLYHTEDEFTERPIEEYNWAAAAEHADSLGAQVFSTSLGYTEFDTAYSQFNHTYASLNGDSTVITKAANIAAQKGILVLNSVGNEGNKPWHYIAAPADGKYVLAVGSVDANRNLSPFSSRGPNSSAQIKPDLCTQGSNSAVINTNGILTSSFSGTSFSCPILAGCAACLWQAFPLKTNFEIMDAIIQSADRYTTPDSNYGYGIPDFYAAFKTLQQTTIPFSPPLVFPNPFSADLTVKVYANTTGNYTIEIANLLGQIVYQNKRWMVEKTDALIHPSLTNQLAGEYLIRIKTPTNRYATKVVKWK